MYKRTLGETIFDWFVIAGMAVILLVTVYPFWSQVVLSLSGNPYSIKLLIWPDSFTLQSYKLALEYKSLWVGYLNTITRSVIAVTLSLTVASMLSYGLSKFDLPFNRSITGYLLFTMLFSGGLIPSYLLIKNMGLLNSVWALVLPGLVSVFHVFILRNFFRSIPESLEESARVDGAGYFYIFVRVIVPLSKPVLATVSLWVGVYHWNEWFHAMIYIQDTSKFVLQVVLRKIIIDNNMDSLEALMFQADSQTTKFSGRQLQATMIMFSILPMLLVYPFIQKYFVKGIMLGAIKG
jgi:putative aldouronate transport system permease protein